jgi:hypothetical protein
LQAAIFSVVDLGEDQKIAAFGSGHWTVLAVICLYKTVLV